MPRLQPLLIPIAAFTAVLLIAQTHWGSAFSTQILHGKEVPQTTLALSGLEHPKVQLDLAEESPHTYIVLQLSGTNTQRPVTLTTPIEWRFQELSGVHVKEMERRASERHTTYIFPAGTEQVTLRFLTTAYMDAIAFTHDSPSPALFTLTTLTVPGAQHTKNVQIVEEGRVFAL